MSDDNLPAVAAPQAVEMMRFIAHAVSDPTVDVEKLRALLSINREITADAAKVSFNQAFIRLQQRLPRIKKNGALEYPVNKNDPEGRKKLIAKFAKWEDIDTAIRPILEEEGFGLSFNTAPRQGDGGGLLVTAILVHRDGHSTETSIPVPLDSSGGKNNLQGYGSSLSYGKRYAATAALNLITEGEDDNGERGGKSFISEDQVTELVDMAKGAGRQEGAILQHMFAGTIRSFDEVEVGPGYLALKNTLAAIIHQKKSKP